MRKKPRAKQMGSGHNNHADFDRSAPLASNSLPTLVPSEGQDRSGRGPDEVEDLAYRQDAQFDTTRWTRLSASRFDQAFICLNDAVDLRIN